MAGRPCPILRATSLSLQGEPADIEKGMISARPSCQGVGSDPETFGFEKVSGSQTDFLRAEARPTGRAVSRERLGDWDGPMVV